jgi:hypothetical protein
MSQCISTPRYVTFLHVGLYGDRFRHCSLKYRLLDIIHVGVEDWLMLTLWYLGHISQQKPFLSGPRVNFVNGGAHFPWLIQRHCFCRLD